MIVLDLYCGGGGFSAGFKEIGIETIWAIDNNKTACNVFKYNFPNCEVVCNDILTQKDFPQADIIIGSPPCVEFSKGNINRTFDTALINRMLEIIDIVKPKYWVLENVPDAFDFVDAPVKLILNANNYGCATTRKRLFAGKFPINLEEIKGKTINDVIEVNRCGHRQPFKEHVYRKINPDKPYGVLVSQRIGNERYLLPNGTSLTTSEMAIIQGFPSWFVFPCSVSEMQRLIGNSVCPPVAKAIAEAILNEGNL